MDGDSTVITNDDAITFGALSINIAYIPIPYMYMYVHTYILINLSIHQ